MLTLVLSFLAEAILVASSYCLYPNQPYARIINIQAYSVTKV
jgi:hypothetical protein